MNSADDNNPRAGDDNIRTYDNNIRKDAGQGAAQGGDGGALPPPPKPGYVWQGGARPGNAGRRGAAQGGASQRGSWQSAGAQSKERFKLYLSGNAGNAAGARGKLRASSSLANTIDTGDIARTVRAAGGANSNASRSGASSANGGAAGAASANGNVAGARAANGGASASRANGEASRANGEASASRAGVRAAPARATAERAYGGRRRESLGGADRRHAGEGEGGAAGNGGSHGGEAGGIGGKAAKSGRGGRGGLRDMDDGGFALLKGGEAGDMPNGEPRAESRRSGARQKPYARAPQRPAPDGFAGDMRGNGFPGAGFAGGGDFADGNGGDDFAGDSGGFGGDYAGGDGGIGNDFADGNDGGFADSGAPYNGFTDAYAPGGGRNGGAFAGGNAAYQDGGAGGAAYQDGAAYPDDGAGSAAYHRDDDMGGAAYQGGMAYPNDGTAGAAYPNDGEGDLAYPGDGEDGGNFGPAYANGADDSADGGDGGDAGGAPPGSARPVWQNVLFRILTGFKWVFIYMGRFFATVFKTAIVIVMVVGFGVMGAGLGAVYGYIQNVEPITSDMLEIKVLTSYIYDADGNEMARLTGRENVNRVPVKYENIAPMLPKAFIAIEDERFESHNGVDIKRIGSAAIGFVTNAGSSHGASTITQQLVKHVTGNKFETLERKVQEWYLAIELEKGMEKWKILELYMNLIYFSNGCYGVQSASSAYFGKDVAELSLAECAFLAGIPNSPSRNNPYTDSGKANAFSRQRDILKKMLELGMISQRQHDAARAEQLTILPKQAAASVTKPHSYFVDTVINDVKKDLMAEKGMTDTMALMTIYSNGVKIYATQSSSIQAAMDEVFTNDDYFPKINPGAIEHDEQPQSAMVVLDPTTAQIKAMYGGYGEKQASSTFNRATQAKRQPGSSIKPIAVYGPALDQRAITPATVIDDAPMHLDPNDPARVYPSNSNNRFGGLTTIRAAVRRSVNVVAMKVWGMIPDTSLSYLSKVGINRDSERNVALALGGLHNGVSPLEMAAAYAPFVNRGMYYEPITYTRVLDSNGKVLLDKTSRQPSIVYSEQAAFLMTSMLQDVVKSGTGTAAALSGGDMPSAGKTGTTNDNADRWFVGYTPYYVAATWFGYDNSIKKITLSSGELDNAMLIWKAVMEKAHENLAPKEFAMPDQIVSASVCAYSGKAPTEYCASDPRGNAIRTEYFIKGTEPKSSDPCDVHRPVVLCGATSDLLGEPVLAGPYCPPSSLRTSVVVRRPVQSERLPGDPYPSDWEYEYAGYPSCPYHTEYGIAPEYLPDGGVSGGSAPDGGLDGSGSAGAGIGTGIGAGAEAGAGDGLGGGAGEGAPGSGPDGTLSAGGSSGGRDGGGALSQNAGGEPAGAAGSQGSAGAGSGAGAVTGAETTGAGTGAGAGESQAGQSGQSGQAGEPGATAERTSRPTRTPRPRASPSPTD